MTTRAALAEMVRAHNNVILSAFDESRGRCLWCAALARRDGLRAQGPHYDACPVAISAAALKSWAERTSVDHETEFLEALRKSLRLVSGQSEATVAACVAALFEAHIGLPAWRPTPDTGNMKFEWMRRKRPAKEGSREE